jgi:hypothetical protein
MSVERQTKAATMRAIRESWLSRNGNEAVLGVFILLLHWVRRKVMKRLDGNSSEVQIIKPS